MVETMSQRLTEITDIPSISGNEKKISEYLRKKYEPLCDEIVYDNLGSIYAVKKSTNPDAARVMVHAHMDELGFIVKKIQENGTIQALALGKVEPNALLGQVVKLTNRAGDTFKGVILGFNQANLALDKNNIVLLDIGLSSAQEAENSGITFGDMVTFDTPFFASSNGKEIYAHNWNGRLGAALGVHLLEAVKEESFDFDLYVGCAVQEHVGLRGAQTATNLVKPDLALVLDTERAMDYQKDAMDVIGELGKGLLITYYDTTVLPNRLLVNTLKELCQKEEIPYQYYYSMEDSDAGWINKLRTGAPTLFLNTAVRNMNTPLQAIALADYQAVQTALVKFILQLTNDQIDAFKCENR
ncbi:MAG: M42 family peptidase [Lactobacillales bacterium]|jgi:glutamyl aminopeptidase|nr:M42 family peptidase [Lactobacillales bacterium]